MRYKITKDSMGAIIIYCLCPDRSFYKNLAKICEKDNLLSISACTINECDCVFTYQKEDLKLWRGLFKLGGIETVRESIRNWNEQNV